MLTKTQECINEIQKMLTDDVYITDKQLRDDLSKSYTECIIGRAIRSELRDGAIVMDADVYLTAKTRSMERELRINRKHMQDKISKNIATQRKKEFTPWTGKYAFANERLNKDRESCKSMESMSVTKLSIKNS